MGCFFQNNKGLRASSMFHISILTFRNFPAPSRPWRDSASRVLVQHAAGSSSLPHSSPISKNISAASSGKSALAVPAAEHSPGLELLVLAPVPIAIGRASQKNMQKKIEYLQNQKQKDHFSSCIRPKEHKEKEKGFRTCKKKPIPLFGYCLIFHIPLYCTPVFKPRQSIFSLIN